MIKIGCAAYSYARYFKDGKMNYEDFIEEAYRLGLDGVELTLYWLPSKDAIYLRKLKRLSLARGLSISGAGVSTDFFSPDVSKREVGIKTLKEGLDAARELGAPCLRVFAGWKIPEGYTEADARKWTVESVRSCVCYAEDVGVVIAMENHGAQVTNKAENMMKIIKEVNSPWFGVNLDVGNYHQSTYDEIAKTVPYTVHIHAKVSIGRGEKLDYQKVKKILEEGGYNGFVSIEYEEQEDPKTEVPKFANYLLNLFR